MRNRTTSFCALLCACVLLIACSPQQGPGEPPPASDSTPTRETAAPEAAPEEATRTAPPAPTEPPPAQPAEPAEPADVVDTTAVVDIGGPVGVEAPKAGLNRIGSDKCKLCHKVQFASWAETAHARREPPLDCEGCHGPGSEYKTVAVMKDPQKARAAGLVIPERSFCSQCHRSGWTDELLKQAHAHKVEGD